jgi:hypothetical protein
MGEYFELYSCKGDAVRDVTVRVSSAEWRVCAGR